MLNAHKGLLKVAVLLLCCFILIIALQGKAGDCFALSGSEGRNGGPSTSLADVTDEEVKDFIRSFHRSVVLMTNELDVSEEEIGRYLDLQDEKMRIMQNMLLDDVFRT